VLQPSGAALFSVRWSSSRPFVFAAAAGDGRVYFFDLLAPQRLLAPVLVLVPGQQEEEGPAAGAVPGGGRQRSRQQQGPVYAIEFCGADGGLFAASSGRGTQVWRLPPELSDAAAGEAGLFRKVMAADDVVQALRELA
jgi:hypothetical protein